MKPITKHQQRRSIRSFDSSVHGVEYDLEDIVAGKVDFGNSDSNSNSNSEPDNITENDTHFTFDTLSTGRRTRPKKSREGPTVRRLSSSAFSDAGCSDIERNLSNLRINASDNDEEKTNIEPNKLYQDYDDTTSKKSQSVLIPKYHRRSSSVSFSTVEIRHYDRILGDNPSCSCGPPLSIGWYHDESSTIVDTVDDYEYSRTTRRGHKELTIPKSERQKLLLKLGYSRKEITQTVRTILKLKKKRRQTVNNLSYLQVEDFFEGASKQISRIMRKRRGSKYLYKQWKGSMSAYADLDSSLGSSLKSSFKISATEGASDFLSVTLDKDSGIFPNQT